VTFRPTTDKHQGETCHGAELVVADRERFRPFRTGIACIMAARALVPEEFGWRTEAYEFIEGIPAFDLLCGSERERQALVNGGALPELERLWVPEERAFRSRRRQYLRYEE
jgi:uncharacterized protein YbbC (DUF1343 family)